MGSQKPRNPAEIRQATAEDVPAIVRARAADAEWGPADPRTGAYLAGEHHPQKAMPPRVMYVARSGGEVVGYVAGHLTRRYECDGELQYLWVVPSARRSGIAAALVMELAAWFERLQARRVCVDVLPDNADARAFYSKLGAVDLNEHWLVWTNIGAALRANASPEIT